MNDRPETFDELQADAEAYESLLIAFDEALANGADSPTVSFSDGLNDDFACGLRQAEICLRMLEQVWPRSRQSLRESTSLGESPSPSSVRLLLDRLLAEGDVSHPGSQKSALPASHETTLDSLEVAARGLARHGRLRNEVAIRSHCQKLLGPFLVVEELGRGGMGTVYKALDTRTNREVAIKCLHHTGPRAVTRLKHEFRCLQNVVHPNLVLLDELYAVDGEWFFSMELIHGRDLVHYVREEGEPDWNRLSASIAQLASALATLHAAGMLHCDIKPSNVLVTDTGRVVLLDFGLTREFAAPGSDTSQRAWLAGTVAYMSPEQAAGQPLSPASDIYSLGVVMYECLTGHWPHLGSREEILAAKRCGTPVAPRVHCCNVPAKLEELCLSLLCFEPGARPTAVQVLTLLGSDQHCSSGTAVLRSVDKASLVGRQSALTALHEAFWVSRQGRTVCVEVRGHAGVGKTTLVSSFLDGLSRETEATILRGRCYEREAVPYKAMDAVIDALVSYLRGVPTQRLAEMLPDHFQAIRQVFPAFARISLPSTHRQSTTRSAIDQPTLRSQAFAGLQDLLAIVACWRPLVIWIDDLQWGDIDSALLVTDLLQSSTAPILVITSYRSEDIAVSSFLQVFVQAVGVKSTGLDWKRVELHPLEPADAKQMAAQLLPANDAVLDQLARESGGHPYLLIELARLRLAGEIIDETTPIDLESMVWRRIEAQGSPARQLLEVVAVAGEPVAQQIAISAAAVEAEVLTALSQLRVGNLLRARGGAETVTLETYHDRIRETVLTRLTVQRRQECHRRLAEVGERTGEVDVEFLAVHYFQAGILDKGVQFAQQAADRASLALAFDRAASWYRQILETGLMDAKEFELRTKLGDSLCNAGYRADAAKEYLLATKEPQLDTRQILELRRRAAKCLITSGHVDEGSAILNEVVKSVGLRFPATQKQAMRRLLWTSLVLWIGRYRYTERSKNEIPQDELERLSVAWTTGTCLGGFDTLRTFESHTYGFRLALKSGDPRHLAIYFTSQYATGGFGDAGRRRNQRARFLTHGRRLMRRDGDSWTKVICLVMESQSRFLAGRWRASYRTLLRAERIATECADVRYEISTCQQSAIPALFYCGEIAEMRQRVSYLLKDAIDHGDLYSATNMRTICNVVWLASDEPARAREEVERAMRDWTVRGCHVQYFFEIMAHLQIDLYVGEGSTAWERVTSSWSRFAGSFLMRIQFIRITLLFLRAASALQAIGAGQSKRTLLKEIHRARNKVARERSRWSAPLVTLLDAGIEVVQGDKARAVGLLEEAADAFVNCDMPLHAAAADRRRGELIGGDFGAELTAAADRWMWEQEIVNPAKVTDMIVPVYLPGCSQLSGLRATTNGR